ncbi:MAG TPA: FAD-dependent oxidoreductase [Pyrinomonadaceae bacterium]|nr:FAD-dependent oxidoreductase [Pyrinomonadaceae bacterium]
MIASQPIWSEYKIRTYPSLGSTTLDADVAIIGAGFTGLSVAYHLLKMDPKKTVVVLEADKLGAGASGHTTGMLGPGVGRNLAGLVNRYGAQTAKALYQATMDAVNNVRNLITNEAIDCELEMSGQIIVARTAAGRRRLKTQAALMDRLELPHELLDEKELDRVIRMVPAPGKPEDGPVGLRLANAGILHPIRLLAGLAACVTRIGGQIFEGARVLRVVNSKANAPVQLQLNNGANVVADRVVIATAGYTPSLGVLRGRILPVHLQVVATEPLDAQTLRAIGWQGREGIVDSRRIFNYFRLTNDNRIVFGGGMPRYHWGGSTERNSSSTERCLDDLASELHRTFPAVSQLRIARAWSGLIGYVADALPAIHLSNAKGAVSHLVGWSGHGVALAVASGAWISSLVLNEQAHERLPWFREKPPLVPFELVRYLGFRSTVKVMSLLDALA